MLIKSIVWAVALLSVAKFCHEKTGQFELYKICSSLAPSAAWELPEPTEKQLAEVRSILDEPFTFLGKGGQSFVFASDTHVIKFFRLSRLRLPLWLEYFPLLAPYRLRIATEKREQLEKDFSSTLTAWKELPQETGLVFVHLNKTGFLQKRVTIVDKIGVAHTLEMDGMEFVIQKRAQLFYPHLEQQWRSGTLEKALSSFVALLKKRCALGVEDLDPNLKGNFGFVGSQAIQIDIGRFERADAGWDPQAELERIVAPLKPWLEERDPALVEYLDQLVRS